MRSMLCLTLAAVLSLSTSGCALLVNGLHEDVRLAVEPQGSHLAVYQWDGTRIATAQEASSGTLSVRRPTRSRSYLVLATRKGSCPQYWLTKATPSGWATLDGALVFFSLVGGLVATIVDGTTGAAADISPDDFAAQLAPAAECTR